METLSKSKNPFNISNKSADFEGIESRFNKLISSDQYLKLCRTIASSKKIYVIGNGGLHYVGSHMATDLTRLIPDKVVKSFDSFGFISSNANDHGWENTFVRWLETVSMLDEPETTLVYGMSCSGNSKNVIKALEYAHTTLKFNTFLFSGRTSKYKPDYVEELCINANYYHTVEVFALMMFYDIVHKIGESCPEINR
tara:strand:+ start:1828 stop:2418 length:591 start_codon:yes stop_codon:yes gene_type:complete